MKYIFICRKEKYQFYSNFYILVFVRKIVSMFSFLGGNIAIGYKFLIKPFRK